MTNNEHNKTAKLGIQQHTRLVISVCNLGKIYWLRAEMIDNVLTIMTIETQKIAKYVMR